MVKRYTAGPDKDTIHEPMFYLGVDPDTKGAIAVFSASTRDIFCIIPFAKQTYAEVRQRLVILGPSNVVKAYIEKQFTIPVNRADSVATLYTHYGRVVEMLASQGIDTVFVRPQEWQAPLGIRPMIQGPNRKKALFDIAKERFKPALKAIKASHTTGEGDACLIAEYGYNIEKGAKNV